MDHKLVSDSLVGVMLGGRYRMIGPLGKGGTGLVYLAIQEPLGREVAVKVLRQDLIDDAHGQFEARFLKEAAATSRLRHRNLVTVHDFGPSESYSGLAYRQRSTIAAASASSTQIALYTAGRTRLEGVPGVDTGITSLAQIDGFGVVLSQTSPRQLYALDDVGWRTLDDSLHRVLVCGMIGFAGGVLVFGQEGQGALYLPDIGVCPLDVLTVRPAHYAARLGDGVVIPADERNNVMQVTFINPR